MTAALDVADCLVLVVDDDVEFQQFLIGEALSAMGITRIAYAADGIAGLDSARSRPPDLIVLDIAMPNMNGFEMLRHLRADPDLAEVPVIVQTGQDSSDHRNQMFSAGATDFVSKPINMAEFQGRVRVHLNNVVLLRQVTGQLQRVAEELTAAAEVQRRLLPTASDLAGLRHDHGLAIDYRFEPSSALGGDFWGTFNLDSHTVAFYVCDFAGHGVSAALNTIRLHTMIDRQPMRPGQDPAGYVAQLNLGLCEQSTSRYFATFILAVVDTVRHTLTYCAAGAPHPMVVSPSGELDILDGSGMPLGVSKSAEYRNLSATFAPGASLFLYSDALSESRNAQGILGTVGIARLLSAALIDPRHDVLDDLLERFRQSTLTRVEDDLTAVLVRRAPGA